MISKARNESIAAVASRQILLSRFELVRLSLAASLLSLIPFHHLCLLIMPTCTRHTCGFSYPSLDSSEFTSTPCFHHPGQPIFHEGSKSWSCCKDVNKPVLDFDDFLKMKGCKEEVGHSNEKKKKTVEEKTREFQQAMEGIKLEDGREVYGQASSSKMNGPAASSVITPSVGPSTSSPVTAPKKQQYVEPSDPEDAMVPPSTTCKRPGCTATSSDSSSPRHRSKEECHYHKGPPIFHDSSKGYLCCKRRVLEFDEFLKIEGCTRATTGHLFVQPPKTIKKTNGSASTADSSQGSTFSRDSLLQRRGLILEEGEEEVDCRMDHYETPDEIRMTIYCKGVQMDKSVILIEEEDLLLSLAMPPLPASSSSRRHLLHLPLYAAVLPAATEGESKAGGGSYYTVSPSKIKIDIILKKKQAGISWPRLDRSGQDVGYGLTFGRK